ncbi:MAG: hypothetical protein C3F11_05365 [Methylocystaceae bacterium]|nr:MAG: hypothetical protein C3F11_05365 [Methylocystaceae bacterium]
MRRSGGVDTALYAPGRKFASSLRAKRSNPEPWCGLLDCFASLAMTDEATFVFSGRTLQARSSRTRGHDASKDAAP